MKKQNLGLSSDNQFGQDAETNLESLHLNSSFDRSEAEMLKLIHELEVHQIELEMQNDELLLAKQKTEQAEIKFRNLYDFAQSGLLSISNSGYIIELNFSAAKMLGKERLYLVGKRLSIFVSDKTRSDFNDFFQNIFISETKQSCEISILNDTNLPRYVAIEGIISENDDICFFTLIDITERKQTDLIIKQQNAELIKLNADKDCFITILAHDLKGPFNSILGFLELLSMNIREYPIDKIEKQINIVNNSAQITFKLLEDILIWVSVNSGKIPFKPQYFDFRDIFDQFIENLKLSAHEKAISINFQSDDVVLLYADKKMISLIMRNLVSNSIKFSKANGSIDIYAKINFSSVTITVSDNGVGIPPLDLPKIFDFSNKFTTRGTNGEEGTGFGLLLCKEFVEIHGGKIWVESVLGDGSQFKFTIPLKS